jgi:23S rRNA pseudouridine1911/1915/1917 synthase
VRNVSVFLAALEQDELAAWSAKAEYTLVECKLLTGRTHQIRVHMAYIGHPVVGDPKYGSPKSRFSIDGQALHGKKLRLEHPVTGQEMVFEAPLPDDMQSILNSLQNRKG